MTNLKRMKIFRDLLVNSYGWNQNISLDDSDKKRYVITEKVPTGIATCADWVSEIAKACQLSMYVQSRNNQIELVVFCS